MDAHAKYRLQHTELQTQKEKDMTRRRTSFTARRGRMNVSFNPSRWGWKRSLKYAFSGSNGTYKLSPPCHRPLSFTRFFQHHWSQGRCGFPVARFGFVPRGSEGLANNLSSPVGGVDSTSTTGPVFRSDQSEADPATLKAGGVEEWRKGGQKEAKEGYCCTDLFLSFFPSLSFYLSLSLPGSECCLVALVAYCNTHAQSWTKENNHY